MSLQGGLSRVLGVWCLRRAACVWAVRAWQDEVERLKQQCAEETATLRAQHAASTAAAAEEERRRAQEQNSFIATLQATIASLQVRRTTHASLHRNACCGDPTTPQLPFSPSRFLLSFSICPTRIIPERTRPLV